MILASTMGSRKTKRDTTSSYNNPFPNILLPAGAASLSGNNVPDWLPDANASGYLVYLSSSQLPPTAEPADFTGRYYAAGQATSSLPITGIQAGTWYYRVAPIQSGVIGDLGIEYSVTAS